MSLREQKSQHLVDTARDLLDEYRYHDITLDIIAQKIGSTKSNFYHYFKSKEELYLEVFLQEVDRSIDRLAKELEPLEGSNNYEAVVHIMAQVMGSKTGTHGIAALLGTTLTQNISDEMANKTETHMKHAILRVSKTVLAAIPVLNFFEVEEYMDFALALKNGLWSEVVASERYRQMFVSARGVTPEKHFVEKLKSGLMLMMRGMVAGKL